MSVTMEVATISISLMTTSSSIVAVTIVTMSMMMIVVAVMMARMISSIAKSIGSIRRHQMAITSQQLQHHLEHRLELLFNVWTTLPMAEHFHPMQCSHDLKCQIDKIMKSSLIYLHVNHVSVPGSLEDSCRMRCIFRRHLSFTGQDKGQFCVKRIITTDSRPQIVTYSDEYNTSNQIKLKFCQSYLSPLRKYL